jgi:potassium/chloride transporter 9
VFYLGFVFNTGMNAVGMVDCVINNFGEQSGIMSQAVPESYVSDNALSCRPLHALTLGFQWFKYLYATAVLVFCTIICLLGSAIFSRASNLLLVILLVSTFSIPFSSLVMSPFEDPSSNVIYTGPSIHTLRQNLLPRFTKGAAGSGTNEK